MEAAEPSQVSATKCMILIADCYVFGDQHIAADFNPLTGNNVGCYADEYIVSQHYCPNLGVQSGAF